MRRMWRSFGRVEWSASDDRFISRSNGGVGGNQQVVGGSNGGSWDEWWRSSINAAIIWWIPKDHCPFQT